MKAHFQAARLILVLMFSVLLPQFCSATIPESLWPDDLAGADSGLQTDYYELGTVFRASVPGKITHVRVYSLAGESGNHTAYLWRNADNALIGGPYPWSYGDATSGWVTLDIPDVTIDAGTDYTVSVSNGDSGQFPFIRDALLSPGTNGRHLSYPASAGVLTTNQAARPTGTYRASNYLRDVLFEPLNPSSNADIVVTGNGHFIAPGDTNASTLDGTDFGSATVNSGSAEQSFAIYNDGSVDLQLSGSPKIAISGTHASDFSVTVQPASPVTSGGSTSFTVRFAPTGVGVRLATLTIANNDPQKNSYVFGVQGKGLLSGQESLFPDSKVGADSGPSPSGQGYELGTIFHSSVAGKIKQLRVYALASETGEHTARVWRNSDNTVVGGPYSWTYGGFSGWITLSIPDLAIDADTDYTVSISTGGGGANFPFIPGDLVTEGNNGNHLFYPADAGVFSTVVGSQPTASFNHNNYLRDIVFVPEGTVTTAPDIELSGKGVVVVNGDTTPRAADGTDLGRAVFPGGTMDQSFTIANTGNAPLNLTGTPLVAISGAQASDFSVVSQPGSMIATGGVATFTIRFAPTATGARRATVSIANNSVKNPYTFSIAASGTIPGQETIWSDTKTPGAVTEDGVHYEMGTAFSASVPGKVTHIRVYSTAQESGEHTAYIWRNNDDAMIGGPYPWTYGGAAGWITLDIPDVAIETNVEYTVSVSTGSDPGYYPYVANDVAVAGDNGEHLFYPANAGAFTLIPGTRPDMSVPANYMRDVVFVPDVAAPLRITSIQADFATGNVTLQWEGDGTLFQVERAFNVAGAYDSIGSLQAEHSFTDAAVLRNHLQVFYRIRK